MTQETFQHIDEDSKKGCLTPLVELVILWAKILEKINQLARKQKDHSYPHFEVKKMGALEKQMVHERLRGLLSFFQTNRTAHLLENGQLCEIWTVEPISPSSPTVVSNYSPEINAEISSEIQAKFFHTARTYLQAGIFESALYDINWQKQVLERQKFQFSPTVYNLIKAELSHLALQAQQNIAVDIKAAPATVYQNAQIVSRSAEYIQDAIRANLQTYGNHGDIIRNIQSLAWEINDPEIITLANQLQTLYFSQNGQPRKTHKTVYQYK